MHGTGLRPADGEPLRGLPAAALPELRNADGDAGALRWVQWEGDGMSEQTLDVDLGTPPADEPAFWALSDWVDLTFPALSEDARTEMHFGARWLLRLLHVAPGLVGKLADETAREDARTYADAHAWQRAIVDEAAALAACWERRAHPPMFAPSGTGAAGDPPDRGIRRGTAGPGEAGDGR